MYALNCLRINYWTRAGYLGLRFIFRNYSSAEDREFCLADKMCTSNQDSLLRCFELHVFSDILLPVKGRKVFISLDK